MREKLKNRTKEFARDCWFLCEGLPKSRGYDSYCRQLIRSSSSVGANYRAACRAKSDADFINKLKIVEEEADESMFWMEMFMEIGVEDKERLKRLHAEANELVAIMVASIKTARGRKSKIENRES